ncbi:MAG: hypothetical protein KUG77_04835 [Nannocystaceae bacterium]|nr:hypothetical protein [Nannocystaceae bacterium]
MKVCKYRRVRPLAFVFVCTVLSSAPLACTNDGGEANAMTAAEHGTTTSSSDDSSGSSSSAATSTAADSSSDGEPVWPQRYAVTADWLGGTLSVLDLDVLASGVTEREAIVVREIDLSAYPPGPLQVELLADDQALVTVSPGFYDGIVGQTIGVGDVTLDGAMLRVDLRTGEVVAEYDTSHVPMGIAISPDGTRAYTANYGHSNAPGDTLSILDLQNDTVLAEVVVGARPEQVSLTPDGTRGIINLAGDGTVRLFETADVSGSLTEPVSTSSDPSDVDFIEGTEFAAVANSINPAVYSLLDVSDPDAVSVVFEAEPLGGFPYGLTPVPGTSDFVMTVANQGVKFTRVNAGSEPPQEAWTVELEEVDAFPMGVAIAPNLGLAISGAPGTNVLVVLDLADGAARTIPWGDATGPTYVAVSPGA